jgi:hypothetical protein
MVAAGGADTSGDDAMNPHERTRLTYSEQHTLLEMERNLDRLRPEPEPNPNWPCQLAGVVVVAVAALLLGSLAAPPRAATWVVVAETALGLVGLLVGAALAIDPVRRFVRSIPPVVGVDRWRRKRLTRQLDGSARQRWSGLRR